MPQKIETSEWDAGWCNALMILDNLVRDHIKENATTKQLRQLIEQMINEPRTDNV